MASSKYSYFVAYDIINGQGKTIQQKNCFMELNQILATEQDIKNFVSDLELNEVGEGQRIFLVSFTQLTGGIEH